MSLSTRLLPLALCVAIAIGATGCPSSSSSSTPAATTTTAAKAADSGSTDSNAPDDSTTDESTPDITTDGGSSSSGTGTGTVKLVDGEAAADKTVTFTADKTFDPEELRVGVGETFTFKAASGTHAVSFNGGSDTYTISGGLIESFQIDAPGTYTASELLTEATMTITVE